MFAYNFMVTTIRAITQELDGFASRYANQIEHVYVDTVLGRGNPKCQRSAADRIVGALKSEETPALVER